jgi:hypothetical protein
LSNISDGLNSWGSQFEIPYMNAGGDDFDYGALTFDGTHTLEIGTGLTDASLAFEYGGGNPKQITVSSSGDLRIHEFSTDIMTFTTALITTHRPIRMDDLAGTGERVVVADADGDLSDGGILAEVSVPRSFVNGSFVESIRGVVTSNGTVITFSLDQSGGGDLIQQFSDGNTILDCTPDPGEMGLIISMDVMGREGMIIPLLLQVL